MTDTTIAYYAAQWESLVKRYESADVAGLQYLLASSFPPGSRLLELGCGSGRDAAFMLSRGVDVTASDAVREMLDAAADCHKDLSGRLFFSVPLQRDDVREDSFDAGGWLSLQQTTRILLR